MQIWYNASLEEDCFIYHEVGRGSIFVHWKAFPSECAWFVPGTVCVEDFD